ncbi:MAG: InlB B-repeat-containing protein, partial [Methanobrevibacter sp.]|nr:InlB B-repeat-containing protein [Methanobrevibacter sp.]
PKTPKKTGYVFNGWYTKKSGGTKITTATKVKKKVTHYAHWKKRTSTSASTSTNVNSLVGHWSKRSYGIIGSTYLYYSNSISYQWGYTFYNYHFFNNGRFQYFQGATGNTKYEGKYAFSKGKVYFKEVKKYDFMSASSDLWNANLKKYGSDMTKWKFLNPVKSKDMTSEYKLTSNKKGNYLEIRPYTSDGGKFTLKDSSTFDKQK